MDCARARYGDTGRPYIDADEASSIIIRRAWELAREKVDAAASPSGKLPAWPFRAPDLVLVRAAVSRLTVA